MYIQPLQKELFITFTFTLGNLSHSEELLQKTDMAMVPEPKEDTFNVSHESLNIEEGEPSTVRKDDISISIYFLDTLVRSTRYIYLM